MTHYTEIESITQEGVEDFYDLTVPVTHCYFDTQNLLHSNSGKDYILAKVYVYYPYMFSHLKDDPISVIGKIAGKTLANKTRIDCVNVAPTEDLGRQVFFDYIKVFLSSPLFDNIRMTPHPSKFAPGTDEIIFPQYKLHLYSKPSTARGLDGYNLLLYAMDEADAFLDNANRSNADEIHKVFRTSSSTRMGRCALGLVFSYPRTETGFMMRLRERAKKSPNLFFWDEAPTHEVRPDFSLDDPQVKEEFVNDYADASAKYLCKPQATNSPFFENADIMNTLMRPATASCADWRTVEEEVEAEDDGTRHKMVRLYIDEVRKEAGRRYYMAIDAGRKQDSFAIAIWSIGEGGKGYSWLCDQCWREASSELEANDYEEFGRDWIESEDKGDSPLCGFCAETPVKRGIGYVTARWRKLKEVGFKRVPVDGAEQTLPYLREEALIEVQPRRKTQVGDWSAEVDFVFAQEALTKLATALDVRAIGADVHQMVTIIQRLRNNAGKRVKEMSFSNPEQVKRAKLCKVVLNRALASWLPNEKRDREWRRLQWQGGSVDHERGGSKDLYDAEAMAIWLACVDAGCVFQFTVS